MPEHRPLASYLISTDYLFLVSEILTRDVVCVFDHKDGREIGVARTSGVGTDQCYFLLTGQKFVVTEFDPESFIARCEQLDLEFIDPRLTPQPSQLATILMWVGAMTCALILAALLILTFTAAL